MKSERTSDLDPRVLGLRLQEARKARGLTQHQAAEVLEVSRPTFVAIEKGERRLQPSELIRLASLYGRSVHELLRQREPIRDFVAHFRTAASASGISGGDLPASVSELQRLCDDYVELEVMCGAPKSHRYPPPYDIEARDLDEVVEEIAVQERNRLGLGDGPVPHLRALLEVDVGLRIFYLPLPSRVAGLFIFSEELGGCVAIQRKHPRGRQLWSLAHEYAHFLVHRYEAEVTVLRTDRRASGRERFANAFAESFLLPAVGLRRRFHDLQRQPQQVTPTTLLTLADLYGVSAEAMLLRLEQLRLIRMGTWEKLQKSGFKVKEAQAILGLDRKPEQPWLPERYQRLAIQAFENGQISEGELAHYLRTDREEARRIAEDLAARPAVSEAGEMGALHFDLAAPLGGTGE